MGPDPEEVPEILSRAEQDDLGKLMIERQMAKNQLLATHQDGQLLDYLAAAQKVHDEEKLATRLGVPQVTLRLARDGPGGLEPLADSWETSEVQMSRARYEKLGGVNQDAPEVIKLKETWPDWKRSTIQIAVVDLEGDISSGLRYDPHLGSIGRTFKDLTRQYAGNGRCVPRTRRGSCEYLILVCHRD